MRDGIGRRTALGAGLAAAAGFGVPRRAASQGAGAGGPIRIGVLNDESGPYADLAGPGSVLAVRMAVADAVAAGLARPVEVLVGDHQNKPDVGLGIVREWCQPGRADVVMDISNSAISLAANPVAEQFGKLVLHVSSTTSDLAGKGCGRNGVQWAQNTYADANGLVQALLKAGRRSFYFITVDYAFGHAVESDATAAVRAGGGQVAGSVRHPLNITDFASYLATAQASGAEVVVLANSGADFITCVKQSNEFGVGRKQLVVAPIVYLTDVHALGLEAAQGLQFIQSWYWDRDEASRAWARRFFAERGRMPTDLQAGAYSAALHFLRGAQATGTAAMPAVLDWMRATPVDDMYTRGARIMPNNKLFLDLLVARVKAPAESRYPWDYLEVVAPVAAADAFRPPGDGACPMAKT